MAAKWADNRAGLWEGGGLQKLTARYEWAGEENPRLYYIQELGLLCKHRICSYSLTDSSRFCQVAHEMAETCEAMIRQDFPDMPIKIQRVKEPREAAVGNGTGIM